MADLNKILDDIKGLSVIELNDLVKLIEEEFGVSAAAMMVAGAAPAAGAGDGGADKTEFNVHLAEVGAEKMKVIKALRESMSLGLKEAKALADGAPSLLKENVPTEEANEIKKKLEEAGAKVELK